MLTIQANSQNSLINFFHYYFFQFLLFFIQIKKSHESLELLLYCYLIYLSKIDIIINSLFLLILFFIRQATEQTI